MKICKSGLHEYPKEHKSCRECKSIRNKEWALKNKERKEANYKKHYQISKESINANCRTYYKNNKEQIKVKQKVWNEANKDSIKANSRKWVLKNKYNINIEERQEIYLIQEGKCAICKRHESELSKVLDIDHSHETGQVRGLLCGDCNRALGLFRDRPEFCHAAGDYLQSHGQPLQEDHNVHCLSHLDDLAPNE